MAERRRSAKVFRVVTSVALVVGVALVGPAVVPAGAADAAAVEAPSPAATPAAAAAGDDQLPQPQQDPGTSRATAREILDRPEFRRPPPGLFERAGSWLSEAFGRLLTGLFTGGVGSALSWGILGLAVAAVALMVVRATRTLRPEPTRPPPDVHVEVQRPPADWLREAAAFEARQQWKAALRCRYRALVGELVARGVVRDIPGRTTGEYRGDVQRGRPEVASGFSGASELFERAWYGDRPTGPVEAARFRELADEVVAHAGRPARHPELALDLDDPAAGR